MPGQIRRTLRLGTNQADQLAGEGMYRWMLYILIALGFALRAINLTEESLWRDEVDTIRFAFVSLEQL
ncbi:MAG: hypothetical protein RMN25_07830, partial [Anaerolineae bacterium]|nr:hypothetical protein [Thermoflexales bacterium]MDW8407681.1 hypothetical protein [Anaerolineae bacterium]